MALADASAIPMRQNIRGVVYPMAGVAGVATLPLARRRGYARALVTELLGQMREAGHAVSALYPFRPSFYQRFGYVGLPRTRTVRFQPAALTDLLRAELPGEITWGPVADGYEAYIDFTQRLLAGQHGFAVLPEYRTIELPNAEDRWLVMAWDGGEPVGAATYQITGYAGVLVADDMLTAGPLGRALLLQFFARHVDQVSEVEVQVGAGELPELWATDLAAVTQATTSFPLAFRIYTRGSKDLGLCDVLRPCGHAASARRQRVRVRPACSAKTDAMVDFPTPPMPARTTKPPGGLRSHRRNCASSKSLSRTTDGSSPVGTATGRAVTRAASGFPTCTRRRGNKKTAADQANPHMATAAPSISAARAGFRENASSISATAASAATAASTVSGSARNRPLWDTAPKCASYRDASAGKRSGQPEVLCDETGGMPQAGVKRTR